MVKNRKMGKICFVSSILGYMSVVGYASYAPGKHAPWQAMRIEDPKTTLAYLVSQAKERFPDLAYLHAVEPRIAGDGDHDPSGGDSNEFLGGKRFTSLQVGSALRWPPRPSRPGAA
jgi:hypothetical protein